MPASSRRSPAASRATADSVAASTSRTISLVKVPKDSHDIVAAALLSVFVRRETGAVEAQWEQVIGMLTEMIHTATALMAEAQEDVLAFRCFPPEHWHKIWSLNPL